MPAAIAAVYDLFCPAPIAQEKWPPLSACLASDLSVSRKSRLRTPGSGPQISSHEPHIGSLAKKSRSEQFVLFHIRFVIRSNILIIKDVLLAKESGL
jgi:hypothetical protein